MRLQQYLTEAKVAKSKFYTKFPDAKLEPEFYTWYTNLLKDCKPFMTFLSGQPRGRYLYRGIKREVFNFGEKKVRSDRQPLNTPKGIHTELDIQLEDRFGWKPRTEGVFVGTTGDMVKYYGEPCAIFPSGKFQYLWCPNVSDSFTFLNSDILFDTYLGLKGYIDLNDAYLSLYGPKGTIDNDGYWWVYIGDGKKLQSTEKNYEKAIQDLKTKVGKEVYNMEWYSEKLGLPSKFSFGDMIKEKVFNKDDKEYEDLRHEIIGEILDKKLKYRDDGLDIAIKGRVEIMIKCTSYYYKSMHSNTLHDYDAWLEWLIWGEK